MCSHDHAIFGVPDHFEMVIGPFAFGSTDDTGEGMRALRAICPRVAPSSDQSTHATSSMGSCRIPRRVRAGIWKDPRGPDGDADSDVQRRLVIARSNRKRCHADDRTGGNHERHVDERVSGWIQLRDHHQRVEPENLGIIERSDAVRPVSRSLVVTARGRIQPRCHAARCDGSGCGDGHFGCRCQVAASRLHADCVQYT